MAKKAYLPLAALALAALFFYWTPLTSSNATPQWDTIDYHQGVLAYFVDSVRSLHLPAWTNDTYSGFPFLNDPQTGIWYPGNWLLVLIGTGPKALQLLLALHALLAGVGMWLLAGRWVGNPKSRLLAGMLYMFSGFFAAHSSHLGIFETAAWLPLLLYAVDVALANRGLRTIALAGATAATVILIGHFQTALYALSAAGLYAVIRRQDWKRFGVVLAGMLVLAVLLSTIQWAPATALLHQSTRSGVGFSAQTNAALVPGGLATLFIPNYFHAASGTYSGPPDITQFYYYGGILLLPLAIAGLLNARTRLLAAVLVVAPVWFAFGPHTGLYDVAMFVPGFASVRGPIHIWFVAALGLSLLAAAGAEFAQSKVKANWLLPALILFVFADLFWFNSADNQLAYGRTSYAQRYGDLEDHLAYALGSNLPAGTRFHAPAASASFGPMNGSLTRKLEVTYGYNPLSLQRYMEYFNSAASNPKLLAGMNVGLRINMQAGTLEPVLALPRFYFVKALTAPVPLEQLDPAAQTMVDGGTLNLQPDPAAKLEVLEQGESRSRLRYEVKQQTILRTAIPWFPGWRATAGGTSLQVRRVDHAFLGFIVPPGSGEITIEFTAPYFLAAALISLATAVGAIVLATRRG